MNVGALEGLRVVDLSTYLPGPYATMLLADLGATVIQVESRHGDPARHMPNRAGDDSVLHWWVGRNKRSVALDLKGDDDRAKFLALVADADIVVEGFRPGVAERLGVDYRACRVAKDDIIYCAISSYGQDVRRAKVPAHDLNYAAKSGMLGLTRDDDGEPVLVGFPVTDIAGGMHAAVGLLAAVLHRDRTGQGQYLDVGILASSIGLVGMQLMKALANEPPRHGVDMNLGGDPAYGIYRCRDGKWITIACIEDRFWAHLCHLVDRDDLVDLRTTDPTGTREELEGVFASRDVSEWDALLSTDLDVCYGPVRAIEDVAADEELVDSGIITEQLDTEGRVFPQIANPIFMSATPATLRTPAPRLGSSDASWEPQ